MSTRVTSAIASRRAREKIVRLLFPCCPRPSVAVGEASTLASESSGERTKRHSYSQIRAAYLQKVHEMHPDKSVARDHGTLKDDNVVGKDTHQQFIELKDAWEDYHASVRTTQRHKTGENGGKSTPNSDDEFWEEEDHFTMFGVGCSFSDNPRERDLRNEIMEQACRGWFSSGSLATGEGYHWGRRGNRSSDESSTESKPQLKLSDDNMFVYAETSKEESTTRKYLVETPKARWRR